MRVRVDVRGPDDHGVVRHARQVADLVRSGGVAVVTDRTADPTSVDPTPVDPTPVDLTHAQFTDVLWGSDVGEAASRYEAWAAGATRPLVVTLHDVPGSDPDRRRDARRSAGYARVSAASDGTIVCSRHEADKVVGLGARRPRVIELPLPRFGDDGPAHPTPIPEGLPSLGVLGFVYPGKGHAEVIDAASRCPTPVRVVALGAVSTGHESLAVGLAAHAGERHVELVVTGPLSDRGLADAAGAVTVPIVANGAASASSSLLAWLSCLRRPLVADGAFSREVDGDHPGLVTRYRDGTGLDQLVAAMLRQPAATRLPGRPAWPDAGLAHIEAYRVLIDRERARGDR